MKILLAAVNAKYIHSNLAVFCLKSYAEQHCMSPVNIEVSEYTINQQIDDILRDLYEKQPDVLCLSCYIWNLEYVEEIAAEMSKIMPGLPIWLGGPEVSYDSQQVLQRLPGVKGVMKGEGEKTFAELCDYYGSNSYKDAQPDEILGITFRRKNGEIRENEWRMPMELSEVPFVYDDMELFEHKIIYYETSRGCPFSCSYCLSSIDKRLRFRDLELVKKELQFFIDRKVPQVKFVDRTFNCKHDHAMAIWRYITEHDNGVTNFHFEISADLLNEEELQLISQMRPGLIQLEIGVQSTNETTIREIKRTMKFEQVAKIVKQIEEMGNTHQHLDLIAGLPYEDYESFARSFEDVYILKPHQLQLGFLKVLKGSYMEENKERYDLVYKDKPPYEVLETKWLPYKDILKLKGVEEMVEVYYNSRQFERTLQEVEKDCAKMFEFYTKLWEYYQSNGLHNIQHKRSSRYEILFCFLKLHFPEKEALYQELLTIDYYLRENAKTRPAFAKEDLTDKKSIRNFYEEEVNQHKYLPDYTEYDKNQMRKMTHLEYFSYLGKTILFDYRNRNPINQEARTVVLDLQ